MHACPSPALECTHAWSVQKWDHTLHSYFCLEPANTQLRCWDVCRSEEPLIANLHTLVPVS